MNTLEEMVSQLPITVTVHEPVFLSNEVFKLKEGDVVSATLWNALHSTLINKINSFQTIFKQYSTYFITVFEDLNTLHTDVETINLALTKLDVPDQVYDPESTKPQSGKAIASALINYVPIRSGATWVFDGGNASTSNSVNIPLVLDNVMSDDSENVVINKVIKAYIDAQHNAQQLALTKHTINCNQQIETLELSLEQRITNIINTLSTIEDYPVEVGTFADSPNVVWTYRKWNSGIAECWCSTSFYGNISNLDNDTGTYLSDSFSLNFPTGLFKVGTVPRVFNAQQFGTVAFEVKRRQWSYASNTNTGEYNIYTTRSFAYTTPVDTPFVINFEAKGVWK